MKLTSLMWLSKSTMMSVCTGRICLLRQLWRCPKASRLLFIHLDVISVRFGIMVFRMVSCGFARCTRIWLTLRNIVGIFNWWIYIRIGGLCKVCKRNILAIICCCLEIQLSEGIAFVIELLILVVVVVDLFILWFSAFIITKALSFCTVCWLLIISNDWKFWLLQSVSLLLLVLLMRPIRRIALFTRYLLSRLLFRLLRLYLFFLNWLYLTLALIL